MVSTHLKKYARQIGSFPQFSGWKLKEYLIETTTQYTNNIPNSYFICPNLPKPCSYGCFQKPKATKTKPPVAPVLGRYLPRHGVGSPSRQRPRNSWRPRGTKAMDFQPLWGVYLVLPCQKWVWLSANDPRIPSLTSSWVEVYTYTWRIIPVSKWLVTMVFEVP